MYLATLDDTNEDVIVKFTVTVRYKEAAHRSGPQVQVLAGAQLSPKLHSVGVSSVTYV